LVARRDNRKGRRMRGDFKGAGHRLLCSNCVNSIDAGLFDKIFRSNASQYQANSMVLVYSCALCSLVSFFF
jgi:hypothetical protein